MNHIKGTEILKKILKDTGNTTIFGYPGGAIMPFYDEIYNDSDFKSVLMRHEQAAGHAAEGYANASGKLGVVMTTSGPGATNVITALANAFYDSSPLLAFSGQVSTQLIGNDAFQEADLIGSTMALTKHNYLLKEVDNLGRVFKEAIYIASSGRPGPVFIDLPKNVQLAESSLANPIPSEINLVGYNPNLFSNAVTRQLKMALEMVSQAKYPVILAGGGLIISGAHQELAQLVKLLHIPVVYTLKGKGILSDDHRFVLGMIGMHGRKRANFALCESDLIIAVGCRFSDRITGNLDHFPPQAGAKVIHIDIDAAEIGKNVEVDLPIVADAKLALEAFNSLIEEQLTAGRFIHTSWWDKFIDELKHSEGIPNITYKSKSGKIFPEKVMYELNHILEPDDIVVTEVGQNQMYCGHFLSIKKPRTWITSGGLGTMGFGFPASIGAKIAKPDSEVWLIAGDGSFQMNSAELATLKQHNVKVNIIILNNQYLGMVRQWQELFCDKRYAGTCLQCDNGEYWPDFVKLANAYGFQGVRIENPLLIGDAFQRSKESAESMLIEIMIEPESNILPMLSPGGALDRFIDESGKFKSIYEIYRPLPKYTSEIDGYQLQFVNADRSRDFTSQEG